MNTNLFPDFENPLDDANNLKTSIDGVGRVIVKKENRSWQKLKCIILMFLKSLACFLIIGLLFSIIYSAILFPYESQKEDTRKSKPAAIESSLFDNHLNANATLIGEWKLILQSNYDEFFKEIGLYQQIGLKEKGQLCISYDGLYWTYFRKVEQNGKIIENTLKFKEGQIFEEKRKNGTLKSYVIVESERKHIQVSFGIAEINITRELIDEDRLQTTIKRKGVKAVPTSIFQRKQLV